MVAKLCRTDSRGSHHSHGDTRPALYGLRSSAITMLFDGEDAHRNTERILPQQLVLSRYRKRLHARLGGTCEHPSKTYVALCRRNSCPAGTPRRFADVRILADRTVGVAHAAGRLRCTGGILLRVQAGKPALRQIMPTATFGGIGSSGTYSVCTHSRLQASECHLHHCRSGVRQAQRLHGGSACGAVLQLLFSDRDRGRPGRCMPGDW